MRGLENRGDVRASDRALPLISVQHYGLEGLLAQPVLREPRITEHWSGPVPWFGQV